MDTVQILSSLRKQGPIITGVVILKRQHLCVSSLLSQGRRWVFRFPLLRVRRRHRPHRIAFAEQRAGAGDHDVAFLDAALDFDLA